MTPGAAAGTVAAGLLVCGFAAVGEALLGRTSKTLFAWNESFLIGTGICGALLFPFSLIAPSGAIAAEFGLMITAAVVLVGRKILRESSPKPSRPSSESRRGAFDGIAFAMIAAIVLLALGFGALNLRYGHSWDSVQVWGTRAQMLFAQGGLSRHWFPEQAYDARLLGYPPLIPLFEALLCRALGAFDFDAFKPVFFPFYVSLLLATYAAARTRCSRRWALVATLLTALLPELSSGSAAGGYADMPLAAFVAAVVAASLRTDEKDRGWRSALPWLMGTMTTLKQEGMVLALLAACAILLAWIIEQPRRLRARIRSSWAAALVVLAFIAARVSYVRWLGIHDATWGPFDAAHRARALKSIGLVASLCLKFMLDPATWGLFWPAFLVAAALIATSSSPRLTVVALAVTATMAVYAAMFLMTNWAIEEHISGAYTRLLAQLAPAAAVVIAAAGQRIWSRRSPDASSSSEARASAAVGMP
jgi:hypothetical protein